MERNGESWGRGKWRQGNGGREIRTFGAGVNDFHDKINTLTSWGVRVGRAVEGVAVEEAVVVGVGSAVGAAVPVVVGVERATGAAEALVVFFFRGAILKNLRYWNRSLGLKRTS